MKDSKKKIVYVLIILLISVSTMSCFLTGVSGKEETEQFLDGMVSLVLAPVEKATTQMDERTYSDDLAGELAELVDSRSHEMEFVMEIEDLDVSSDDGFDVEQIRGGRLELESAYDMTTGDGVFEFYGFGLVNGTLAMSGPELALDMPSLLEEMFILEYQSELDFSRSIPFSDRMLDINAALNNQSSTADADFYDDLELIMNTYADVIAEFIDPGELAVEDSEIEIAGEMTPVEMITIDLDEFDLEDIFRGVLEYAKDDDFLIDFLIEYGEMFSSLFSTVTYDEPDTELRESDILEAIEYALEDLDYFVDDNEGLDISLSIYFAHTGFLSNVIPGLPLIQQQEPVAIEVDFDDTYTEVEMRYTYFDTDDSNFVAFEFSGGDDWTDADGYIEVFTQDRAFDLSAALNVEDEVDFSLALSNVKDGDSYLLDGQMSMFQYYSETELEAEFSGETLITNQSEEGSFEIVFNFNDGWSIAEGEIEIENQLNQVSKGTSYEAGSEIVVNVTMDGEDLGMELSTETEWAFMDQVSVDLPDFDDTDAQRYDSIQELFEDLFATYW